LDAVYGEANERSLLKEINHISADYRRFIDASPFVILASVGDEGMDCSPKGDPAGFVHVMDEKTLVIPDRPGNNRIDNLRNIIVDPRVALLFLIPGHGETLRVNGRAKISIDPALLARFAMHGKLPRSAIVVEVDAVYFHCSKAVVRAKLWDADAHVDQPTLPTAGTIMSNLTKGQFDGHRYDQDAPERIKNTLY
jgi:PPOX class probable FMN-dependent enzyme